MLLALLILSGWLYLLSRKEHARDTTIGAEIARLEAESEKMRQENLSLKERIAYFSSDAFQEREAKEKLDYKKQDERVVAVRPSRESVSVPTLLSSAESRYNGEDVPNHRKWWRLFW
ncbi:MAG: septum formation initiator family protein [Candidatus Moranbacteria bacterium]|nr:septum formation initiator family protein [Candidatus Moranbacteria bacterium]